MDCRLPELDGLEATRKIRESEKTQEFKEDVRNGDNRSIEEILEQVQDFPSSHHWSRRIPIIGLTANITPDKTEKGRQAGMDEFFIKPFTLSHLENILSRWTASNGQSSPAKMPSDREVLPNQEPLDATVIEKLRDIGGTEDPQFLPRVISRFLSAAPSCFCKLEKAVEHHDGEALADAAHALENSCRFIGAHRLGDMCTRLEALGHEGVIAEGDKVLQNLKAEYQQVYEALETQKLIVNQTGFVPGWMNLRTIRTRHSEKHKKSSWG